MNWRRAIPFGAAFALFGIGAVTHIALPGVYMDSVFPDYVIVRLLNPAARDMYAWYLPGTMLFGLFPIIGAIYHGALPYYIGLPFYALFGTGVVGIRLTNLVFGLVVLSGTGTFMLAFGVRPLICSLCLALLALDPGFLFSFRTQFYITLLPVAWLFASAALVEVRSQTPTRRAIAVAGLLAGIACYGYFIYFFLVPSVAAFAVYRWRASAPLNQVVVWWAVGFLTGVMPYILVLLLILKNSGSPHDFIDSLRQILRETAPQSSILSVIERVEYFSRLVRGTVLDVGPSTMMLGTQVETFAPDLKLALLLFAPVCAILTGLSRPARVGGLLVLAGIMLGFLVLVLAFGDRLWFHHAAFVLPLLYAGLALTLERIASLLAFFKLRCTELVALVVTVPFLVANASDRQAVFLQLQITHGVGLSSDAISRFSEDSLLRSSHLHIFFPDWGVFMPFAMITRGTIPYSADFAAASARAVLCRGQDAEVVVMADKPKKRLDDWVAEIGWGHPEMTHYDQRDGTPVLYVARWHSLERPENVCP
jgi:hypothetical protein